MKGLGHLALSRLRSSQNWSWFHKEEWRPNPASWLPSHGRYVPTEEQQAKIDHRRRLYKIAKAARGLGVNPGAEEQNAPD